MKLLLALTFAVSIFVLHDSLQKSISSQLGHSYTNLNWAARRKAFPMRLARDLVGLVPTRRLLPLVLSFTSHSLHCLTATISHPKSLLIGMDPGFDSYRSIFLVVIPLI